MIVDTHLVTVTARHVTVDTHHVTVTARHVTVDTRHVTVTARHVTVDTPHVTVDTPHVTADIRSFGRERSCEKYARQTAGSARCSFTTRPRGEPGWLVQDQCRTVQL